ncbi:MAG: permease [Paenibacillus sp.]|jgi:pimeloyl-ACP methyl ester carboxylesterase|uniref:alpha/beta hydrolase family protein n=1 Tax=Paenibacillus sp. GCM10012303 TaxID=3317340 RepID=UPI0029EBED43|nr:permease [Paenibacillus sp.]
MERAITIQYGSIELKATLHYPAAAGESKCSEGGQRPLIVICHGFIGSRIGVDRLFVGASRKFAEAGYMVLRFDYAGCGESTGEYGENGLDSMIDQTRIVLDYALGIDYVDANRVILLGHSLGGAAALLTAALDRRVKTLVMWSAVAHPFNDILRIVGQQSYDDAVRYGSSDHMGYTLRPAFFESLSAQQPFAQIRKFTGDVFLAHGTSDQTIPADYCSLYQKLFWMRSYGQCDMELIFQADHTYSTGESKRELYDKTLHWLTYNEKRKREWHNWEI